jgi:ABC-type uncharacterized transport system permease subunit
MYVGAFAAALVAFTFTSIPGPMLIVLSFAAGVGAGALWAVIPAVLYAYYDVSVIVTTLMFNYLAMLLTAYLVEGPYHDPASGSADSPMIASSAHLAPILGLGGADIGLYVGLVVLGVGGAALALTRWGLQARFVGGSKRFAQYVGVRVHARIIQIMLVSGAMAGAAGVVETLGTQFRFNQDFSPGFGFLGLTVALLGRLKPSGILLGGILYAALEAGAGVMQLNTNVPLALVELLEGIIVVLITATTFKFSHRRGRVSGSADSGGLAEGVLNPVEGVR